ncbi:ZIP family metal transporter [Dechloromonas sp.]|uniref:ZIP family metal transporter n=1 Tax=Dechloromonas sp. TaxID=1917218 RepID=UPI0011DB90C8|nr:ZIP family metal transporter [Dechloromonas sp.]MBU3697599.1 ZIP family metal transporter [Dechloromonas sp.]TEX48144.1 MAG: ZIP zinc transporter [Rhodocyclaceae bacterium]TXH01347.1 MAG: ZIP family metal transporter [Rhodocyclaceae bacterium]
MTTLSWIIAVALAGGVLSVAAAAAIGSSLGAHRVNTLISYAIGALLGAVFLEILPHAFEHADPHHMAGTVLVGILVFFVLEKLVLWRHCHHDHCEAHEAHAPAHDHGRSGLLILIGDTFHNFVDGILIAAAFMESTELGIVTAMAIIAHEIPQEVGDYLILLHSGYSRLKALVFNLLSSLATLVGALLAYFALSDLQEWIPTILGLAAASMIYVAVADLIPGLHKRTELKATLQQVLLICLGVGSILLVGELVGH